MRDILQCGDGVQMYGPLSSTRWYKYPMPPFIREAGKREVRQAVACADTSTIECRAHPNARQGSLGGISVRPVGFVEEKPDFLGLFGLEA